MAGFGSLTNPYVENPFANRIINVHWRTGGSHAVGGTCVGFIGLNTGFGPWSGSVGIIDYETGEIYGSFDINIDSPVGSPMTVSFDVSAGGTLLSGQGAAITAFINASGTFVDSGLIYPDHPSAWVTSAISNSGDLSPFGQLCGVDGPSHWTAEFVGTARGGGTAGLSGTITVIKTP